MLTNIQLLHHMIQFIEITIFMQLESVFIELSHILPFQHFL